jgi:psiF repeat
MQRLPGLSAALALCVSTAAFANAHKEAPMIPAASAPASAAQAKAGQCSKKAAGRTGDARDAFMKACLAADAPMSQQDQTRKCEAQAAGKTGDARKAFLQTCLAT